MKKTTENLPCRKSRKMTSRGSQNGPKMAKNRRRGDPKSPKMAKKLFFDVPFFQRFFACEKKRKKSKKGRQTRLRGKGRRSCGGRREGKEGKPFRDRRLNASIQNHASTPLGYGEFKALRTTAAPPIEGLGELGRESKRRVTN